MKRFLKITVIILLSVCLMATTQSCTKKPTIPTLTTATVSAITQTSAISGGNVTGDGGAAVTARGVCWGTSQSPTTGSSKTSDGTGTGTFTSSITGLTANTTYYVRAYATNSEGTSYGNEVSFPTSPISLATLTTTTVTSITAATAVSGGDITSDGGGAITARGVCWSKATAPLATGLHTTEIGTTGTFTSNLTGLTENTNYYIRAYAINSAGTAYGDEKSFTTDQLKDADGNVYTTVTIGTQTWMKENLKVTKYRNGDVISPETSDDTYWSTTTSGAFCWYNNDAATHKNVYGALYNWHAVNDTRKLCPAGWHVPSDAEWTTLTQHLGGVGVAGGKLKSTTGWTSPNEGATDEVGFSALPGGLRESYGVWTMVGYYGWWWSSSDVPDQVGYAWERYMGNSSVDVTASPGGKSCGLSIRCLKD
jgi:uncharacterized protein (TIGR02145 family)